MGKVSGGQAIARSHDDYMRDDAKSPPIDAGERSVVMSELLEYGICEGQGVGWE